MGVLGVGHCTLEHIGVVERFAEVDFHVEFEQFTTQGGGCVANALVALSRWGVASRFVGKVGGDARGAEILATLTAEGVDVSPAIVSSEAVSQMAFWVIESDSLAKKLYYTQGSATPLEPEEAPLALLDEAVEMLLVDGAHATVQRALMEAARERGIKTLLDAELLDASATSLIALADHVVCSERFASRFTGQGSLEQMCRALLECGPQQVVVTLGDEGCVAMTRQADTLLRVPAHPVEVFDTAGAGDVFHGAVIFGLLRDWPLERTLRFATIAGALTCRGLGARSSIPTLSELEALLER